MADLTLGRFSRYIRLRHNRRIYAFCLFIDDRREILERIEEVVYTLHPTFPDPVRRHRNIETCFALQSEAWGTFYSTYEVHWKDGRIDLLKYYLDLRENAWPMRERLTEFQSSTEELVYNALFDAGVEWRKISTLSKRAAVTLPEADQLLQSLALRKAVRKAYFRSIDKEELWGSTSVVGLLPEPRH